MFQPEPTVEVLFLDLDSEARECEIRDHDFGLVNKECDT